MDLNGKNSYHKSTELRLRRGLVNKDKLRLRFATIYLGGMGTFANLNFAKSPSKLQKNTFRLSLTSLKQIPLLVFVSVAVLFSHHCTLQHNLQYVPPKEHFLSQLSQNC